MTAPLIANTPGAEYKSLSAREAQLAGYGNKSYWDTLDAHAQRIHDHYIAKGDPKTASAMFTQSLGECLRGNDGD